MRRIVIAVVVFFGLLLVFAGSTVAAVPALTLSTAALPRHLPPGGEGTVTLQVANLGDAAAEGAVSPIVITDTLPEGLEATGVSSGAECALVTVGLVRCEYDGGLVPFNGQIEVVISVRVSGSVSGALVNEASAGGGGAIDAHISEPVLVSSEPAANGLEKLQSVFSDEDGSPDTLAGSHPFQLNATVVPNTANTKDVHVVFPPGFVANTNVVAQCTTAEFDEILFEHVNGCPADSAVGIARAFLGNLGGPSQELVVPVFNLVPARGEPIRLGFAPENIPVIIDTGVRTGKDYAAVANINNIQQLLGFQEAQLTIWGVPADPAHNADRGWNCLFHQLGRYGEGEFPCAPPENQQAVPFLTLPSACTGPNGLVVSANADTWLKPGVFPTEGVTSTPAQGLGGCNRLPFAPSITAAPDGQAASTPTGLAVDVREPEEGALSPTGVSASDEKSITVALPAGVSVNPSGADGLQACTDAQVGFEKISASGLDEFTPGPVSCPDGSKIATVKARTPLLPEALEGEVYLAAPQNFTGPLENPFGSLIALYLVAEDPVAGIRVKAPGKVTLDPVTGQVTTVFENVPQVPVEETELHFFGSARAPLNTPPSCGPYTTQASIGPWSVTEPVTSTSTFEITAGPDGTPCASPRPFQPEFNAGMTSIQAGGYSPLTVTMTRPDSDQTLSRLSIQLPPGLLGALSKVKLCEEPQAATGACGPESLIGHVTASAGLGGDPYTVEGGQVFITGPYKGAPFGLSILEPAVAGPFNLGTIVVRAKIEVDPLDAHLTIVSDPLPTIKDGIPLQIQHVNVLTNRPEFTFDPTSCNPMSVTARLESTEGAQATVSSPFQVTNCAALAFKPTLTVSTSAKTSRIEGASLHVTLTLPAQAGLGTEANVAKVKVSLPKQLPSPLKTLQKACLEKVFAANPKECPVASQVGQARVSTPLLSGPLTGTAYFVSHGGARYPELIIVLVGEDGVTTDVHGETFISKQGITSATFSTVPDVPFSNFELTLPERQYPALTANGDLCKGTLLMPTEMVGQNGAAIQQNTKISVTGCPKIKKASHKKKKGGRHTARGKRKG